MEQNGGGGAAAADSNNTVTIQNDFMYLNQGTTILT